jgi:hypothetical protein
MSKRQHVSLARVAVALWRIAGGEITGPAQTPSSRGDHAIRANSRSLYAGNNGEQPISL